MSDCKELKQWGRFSKDFKKLLKKHRYLEEDSDNFVKAQLIP
ncbi:MAG: hypothetical protein AAGE99_00750 [Chlamydiota bacterium]